MFKYIAGRSVALIFSLLVMGCAPTVQIATVAPRRDTRDYSVCKREAVGGEGRVHVRGDLRIVVNNRLSKGCVILEMQRVGSSLTQRSSLLVPGQTNLVGFSSLDEWDANRARSGAIAGFIIGVLASKDRAKGAVVGGAAGAVLAQEVTSDPRANIIVRVVDENGSRIYESDPQMQNIPTWQAQTRTIWILERNGTIQVQWQY